MPKFKKGDRVVSVKTGAKGVVDEVYGEEKYAVLFDGAANPDRVEGHQIKAANAAPTRGFSFKVGDKAMLVWSRPGAGEIVKLTGKTPAGLFKFKMDDGGVGQVEEKDLAPAFMHNSRACNAKDGFGAEIKVGDRAKFITGTWRGLEGKVTKIEGTKATVKTDEQGEVVEDLKLIRVYNSAPVSTNSVVRNAMAARTARNASDADVARYLAAAKDRIRAEVVALKDVAGLLKMEPVPPSAEKAYAKVVKAMASLQKAFAELS